MNYSIFIKWNIWSFKIVVYKFHIHMYKINDIVKDTKMLARITYGWQDDFYFILYTFIRFHTFSTINTITL